MTSKFDSQNSDFHQCPNDLLQANLDDSQLTEAIDTLKRDRFELLSAYLDGEVTAAQRRQVEAWLATDPGVQRLYGRLISLRQGLRTIPVPSPQQTPERTVQQVFTRLHRRQNQQVLAWGGAAIAALFIGALTGIAPGSRLYEYQTAQVPQPGVQSESLMVALNNPVVEIPKVPVASEKPTKQSLNAQPSNNLD